MNKLLPSFLCCLLLTACDFQSKEEEITDSLLLQQAIEANDWTIALRVSQQILIQEIDHDIRWQALQDLILASKNLGDMSWLITTLETNKYDFKAEKEQEYIYTELIEAYAYIMDYNKAIDASFKLLELDILSREKKEEAEMNLVEYLMVVNDFKTAEDLLLACLDHEDHKHYARSLFLLASIYFLSEKEDEAMQYIELFLAQENIENKDKAQALFMKADILEVREEYKQAQEIYNLALPIHPNPEVIRVRQQNLNKLIEKSK